MSSNGGVPERPNGTVSKTVVEETPPRVRIPAPPPPCFLKKGTKMDDKITSWDNIPSLEDLEFDWECQPDESFFQRGFVRMDDTELEFLLEVREVYARISTRHFLAKGKILDLSQGGTALLATRSIKIGEPVYIGFYLGKKKITTKAIVRNCADISKGFRLGIEFIDLKEDYYNYIENLYYTKILEKS